MERSSPRDFGQLKPFMRCYALPKSAQVDKELYQKLSESGWSNIVKKIVVPKQSARAWELKAGQICRIVVAYGPQVGDVNIWNLDNPKKERFYTGKTRQLHGSHLSIHDGLWSNLPYMNKLATVTQDSLSDYGIDPDGCSVHDVIGTRCDPYTFKKISGNECQYSCHQGLTECIKPWGLDELDVHDVFNIFMCSGFDKNTHDYIIRGSPVQKGDYIELLAEMDLLVALCACPQGDVSGTVTNGDDLGSGCYPLDVYIGQPSEQLVKDWKESKQK